MQLHDLAGEVQDDIQAPGFGGNTYNQQPANAQNSQQQTSEVAEG